MVPHSPLNHLVLTYNSGTHVTTEGPFGGFLVYTGPMNLLHDFVAIEPDKPEEKTDSGLLLAKQIKTYPPYGTVRHVAKGIPDLKPGDRVIYKVYASVDVKDNLAVIPYDGIIAKL